MKIFQQQEIRAAYAHAAAGGQALHVFSGAFAYMQARTPNCFKGRRQIAHLFDQDHERLLATVKRLGVRVVKVEHPGTHRQHVDLCGRPLDRAIALANEEIEQTKNTLLPLDLGQEIQRAHYHELPMGLPQDQ